MQLPVNSFKQAMLDRQRQIGLWVGLAGAYTAEAVACTGFDWLLIDAEHAPNDVRSVLAQLQAVAPYPTHPIVRPVVGDVALIKQLLDVGTQTLLIPMVETAEQAALMVAATRYPPNGIRGVGSALARSSRGTRSTTTCTRLIRKSACWCRLRTSAASTTSPRSRLSTAWTACSSARPISRRRLASWASLATRRYSA